MTIFHSYVGSLEATTPPQKKTVQLLSQQPCRAVWPHLPYFHRAPEPRNSHGSRWLSAPRYPKLQWVVIGLPMPLVPLQPGRFFWIWPMGDQKHGELYQYVNALRRELRTLKNMDHCEYRICLDGPTSLKHLHHDASWRIIIWNRAKKNNFHSSAHSRSRGMRCAILLQSHSWKNTAVGDVSICVNIECPENPVEFGHSSNGNCPSGAPAFSILRQTTRNIWNMQETTYMMKGQLRGNPTTSASYYTLKVDIHDIWWYMHSFPQFPLGFP